MKLYNPTPEAIPGAFDGKTYPINSNSVIDVPDLVGNWIMEREAFRGLVILELKALIADAKKNSKSLIEKHIVEQAYKGLEKYIQMKNDILGQWINLDTEIKGQNQYGTVLQSKDVKLCGKWIEMAKAMIKDLEAKYKVSFEKNEIIEKSTELQTSISSIITEFEADAEKKSFAEQQEREMNNILKDFIPKPSNITGNTNVSI